MGCFETLEQVVDGVKFLIHCQKEENFKKKIMSSPGVLTQANDHDTFCDGTNADGSKLKIKFKYPKLYQATTEPRIPYLWALNQHFHFHIDSNHLDQN